MGISIVEHNEDILIKSGFARSRLASTIQIRIFIKTVRPLVT